jgi:hypothetical protein
MTTATQEDLYFRAPDDWIDRSVLVLTAPDALEGEHPPSFVVTRDVLAPAQTMAAYVERAIDELAGTLEWFEIIDRSPMIVADREAMSILFRFHSANGEMMQRLVFLAGAGQVLFCLTACAPSERYRYVEPTLRAIYQSVRLP